MTNQQKYPTARIQSNPDALIICGGIWYIKLKEECYLKNDGSVSSHDHDRPSDTYYKTKLAAEKALDKFMNDKPEITLSEIKSQYEEAKKLIGKKVKCQTSSDQGTVEVVNLRVDFPASSSDSVRKYFKVYGYVIEMAYAMPHQSFSYYSPYPEVELVNNVISVVAHDGQTYTAEDDGKCWKFGCAKISKILIKESYKLFDTLFSDGNREIKKITIGACDFDHETLKRLVNFQNNDA